MEAERFDGRWPLVGLTNDGTCGGGRFDVNILRMLAAGAGGIDELWASDVRKKHVMTSRT